MKKNGHAFIGCSLDSKFFTREWIQYAIPSLLEKHNSILILIAEELLRYTRTLTLTPTKHLDFKGVSSMIHDRRTEFHAFLRSEIQKLSKHHQDNITIKYWGDLINFDYTLIFRNLYISYLTIDDFSKDIKKNALNHISSNNLLKNIPNSYYLNVAYILDEISMSLRVTELDKYHYEYYPCNELEILKKLYNDEFKKYGLCVETLVGHKPKRIFSSLNLKN